MALIPWRRKVSEVQSSAESPLALLREEFDRFFDRFFAEPFGALDWPAWFTGQAWWPAVDVHEDEQHVVLRAEVPGLKPEEIEVSVTGRQLTLSGEKKETAERKEGGYYRSECRYGKFRRVLDLPQTVDPEQIEATLAEGVLTIRLKKTAEAQSRRIPIKAGQ